MPKKFPGLDFDHTWNRFEQTDWIRLKGMMGNSDGVCYGLSSFWLTTGGGKAFQTFTKSDEAKEEVQTFQGSQHGGSAIQAALKAANHKILRDGHLYYYPLEQMLSAISDPGHYLIGLKTDGVNGGHAIACSNIVKGARVFDPNVGQISCNDKGKMSTIVRTICSEYQYNTAMWVKSLT
jgi:hypothetical protein